MEIAILVLTIVNLFMLAAFISMFSGDVVMLQRKVLEQKEEIKRLQDQVNESQNSKEQTEHPTGDPFE